MVQQIKVLADSPTTSILFQISPRKKRDTWSLSSHTTLMPDTPYSLIRHTHTLSNTNVHTCTHSHKHTHAHTLINIHKQFFLNLSCCFLLKFNLSSMCSFISELCHLSKNTFQLDMVAHTRGGRKMPGLRPAWEQVQGQKELYNKTLSQIKGQECSLGAAGFPSMNMALSPIPAPQEKMQLNK